MSPAGATTHRGLTQAQVHRIVNFTGYQGLRSHRFDVAGVFKAGAATIKVVRLDGARLPIRLSELRRDVAQANDIAQQGGTFTSTLKVGPGKKQRITYHVAPSTHPNEPNLRYFVFAPRSEQLDSLTSPVRAPSIQALTLVGKKRLAVTLLHDRSPNATWQGTRIPYADICALIESFNSASRVTVARSTLRRLAAHHVDLSYLTDPNHSNPTRHRELMNLAGRGYEIWSNSLGFAITSAQSNVPYHRYRGMLSQMAFSYYARNQMHFLALSATAYRQFAATG
ncbi:MAG TPA: hypothetical protein VHD81_00115 [Mycobacteriales bacterium]|nr:hypothetical protein [Mycobacteriales bacterium]